ncbi:MAG TPA: tRNA (adenosine(37)-N6)-threonylcarbamoyltransferase complex dimerization subunit type 1 TsaB [Acidiferrobacterales bacterium]
MRLLALDTSTEACSAALTLDGRISERFLLGRQHSSQLLAMIAELLAEAGIALKQLDALAFGRGPGAFTGLRIGTGVVQGLAFGAGLPVVPVSSLAALAQGESAPRVLAALDARMGQVYWGAFERDAGGLMRPAGAEGLVTPATLTPPPGRWWGVGRGWDAYGEALRDRLGPVLEGYTPNAWPHAAQVAVLGAAGFAAGAGVPAEQALPVYLRDDVARPARRG